jgi:hypothetical protein
VSSGETAPGAHLVFSVPQRWVLLGLFALIVMMRLPNVWLHGRFQDEEATVFLAYAWHFDWLDALFRPFGGYWNFAANATTLVLAKLAQAGVIPLERAPYFTMVIALAVQLLPAVVILTGNAQWLSSRRAVIAALLIIAIAPATEEVFFNVLHIQFHLALCVALILALDVPARRTVRLGCGVLLFLAPLCGPGAIVMLPLFALRALADRDRARLMQAVPLVAGAAVQLLLFYQGSPLRGHFFDLPTLAAAIFVRMVALPSVGINLASRIAAAIYASRVDGGLLWWWSAAACVLLFGTLLVAAAKRRDGAIWLALSSLSIACISLGFGMVAGESYRFPSLFSVVEGERYNFLPLVLLGLALLVLAARPSFRGSRFCGALCVLMLLSGVSTYAKPLPGLAEGPSWAAEVKVWRKDHHHLLAVWPSPWAADLSNETRPCPAPSRDPARLNDPRYCESGWLAHFYAR